MSNDYQKFDIGTAPLFTALKVVAIILMVVFVVSEFKFEKESTAAFSDVSKAVAAKFSMDNVIEGDNQMVKRLYGIDPNEYAGVYLLYPSTNMGSEELILVKLADPSQKEAARKALDDRVNSQINVFEGYAPDQVDMLKKAKIDVEGNYLLMVSADNPDEIVAEYLKALK